MYMTWSIETEKGGKYDRQSKVHVVPKMNTVGAIYDEL